MNRKLFLKSFAFLPLISYAMNFDKLKKIITNFNNTDLMPVLFLGHGSPMNAIEENGFVKTFRQIGNDIPKPKAIICISAHWETNGTFLTAMTNPKTIYDFMGFPKELYDVKYPAPGNPELAYNIKHLIKNYNLQLNYDWGLDHGAWTVVKHLYPNADVPIIQMSLDYTKSPNYHYNLGKELFEMRKKGVLIIGSGNIIHNLKLVAWDKLNEEGFAFDWAKDVKNKINHFIMQNNHESLINYKQQGKSFELAIPSPEHYLPLLYILALQQKNENVTFYNDKSVGGSLSMTTLKIN